MLSILRFFTTLLTIVIFSVTVIGCATSHYQGIGTVVAEKKISSKDYHKYEATKAGAFNGARTGAIYGAVTGGFLGFFASLMIHNATIPLVIAGTAIGATVYALFGGIIAGTIGAGIGLGQDIYSHGDTLYQITVKPDNHYNQSKNIDIIQYSSKPFSLHERVKILEGENGNLFIKNT